jgi:glycopeptide antibiotics resistance protein
MGSAILNAEWVILPLLLVLPLLIWRDRSREGAARRTLLRVGAACYVAVVVGLAFFPLPLPPYAIGLNQLPDYRGWPYPWASPIPFATIGSSLGLGFEWPAARFLLGNVGAFVPLGVMVPLLSTRWNSWLRVAVAGLAASGAIELMQLAMSLAMGFPYRVADVDDLILNVLGSLVGYAMLRFARAALHRARVRRSEAGDAFHATIQDPLAAGPGSR